MKKMIASDTNFGIEIEMILPNDHSGLFDVGAYHVGCQIPGAPEGWTMQRDGSIAAKTGYFAVEVVSPKLKGEQGLFEVWGVFNQLVNDFGAKVNKTCGLHVHVDGSNLDESDIQKIITRYEGSKHLLYGLNGKKSMMRWTNRYCMSGFIRSNRYQGLNLTNWDNERSRKKTVEFRMFAATLNCESIVTILYTVVGFVVNAVNGDIATETQTVKTFTRDVFSKPSNVLLPDGGVYDVVRNIYRLSKDSDLTL